MGSGALPIDARLRNGGSLLLSFWYPWLRLLRRLGRYGQVRAYAFGGEQANIGISLAFTLETDIPPLP